MGVLTVLTLIFVVLKLVGIISWSWWLVLLPSLIDIALAVVIWCVAGLAALRWKR